ncbi:hypothetical protein [Bradyrhizobium sp. URHC0002]
MAIEQPPNSNNALKPARQLLPNRRASGTFTIEHGGALFTVTAGYYRDGQLGELFINSRRASSAIDAIVSDAAIAISFALQFGADLTAIKAAMKRNSAGEPSSPIGAALDRIAP